ncbi:alpha-glucosidase C-terminal domain-containing protein [Treponema primitia]|uniref:alpha-amylase family glycosyl hydrolase n=1 Tax=Treponema primitia TaxID=88058 RepID=UPI0039804ED5
MNSRKMTDRVFYHIYPLGFCGAPERNDFSCPAGGGLRSITEQIPRLLDLGVNALYLGPVFESTAHGYDTLDYYHVDRRIGNNAALRLLVERFHEAGIAVVLDAVFNHTGRHFFAFKDLQARGSASAYRDWFANIDFSRPSPEGDSFSYEGWHGCYDLVKLNGHNREVRDHLLNAAEYWIKEFDIDGLRLDAADLLLPDFLDELSARSKKLKPGFWLMGEVVAGDYTRWTGGSSGVKPGTRLDSVTNYELYKSLWSSFNDKNFYELSWTLNRQFGPEGSFQRIPLYSFADNHDVNRIASVVKNKTHLFPLYGLLFTLPGIPSVYYGSEYGISGERFPNSDSPLRPAWDSPAIRKALEDAGANDLERSIAGFIRLRKKSAALREGSFRELSRAHEQYAFMRETGNERILVVVNAAEQRAAIHITPEALGNAGRGRWRDLLSGEEFTASGMGMDIPVHPSGLRILAEEPLPG